MTVFAPRGLSGDLIKKLDEFRFRDDVDFVSLYESYNWKNDNHRVGFPDIYSLEIQFRKRKKTGGFTLDDIVDVARWGGLTKLKNINIKDQDGFDVANFFLYMRYVIDGNVPLLEKHPEKPATKLAESVDGIIPFHFDEAA